LALAAADFIAARSSARDTFSADFRSFSSESFLVMSDDNDTYRGSGGSEAEAAAGACRCQSTDQW
jgi:hypothetical protein